MGLDNGPTLTEPTADESHLYRDGHLVDVDEYLLFFGIVLAGAVIGGGIIAIIEAVS